ncbi:MAG: hypothetical protein AAFZ15_13120 [Bacteroidota bacterium]
MKKLQNINFHNNLHTDGFVGHDERFIGASLPAARIDDQREGILF